MGPIIIFLVSILTKRRVKIYLFLLMMAPTDATIIVKLVWNNGTVSSGRRCLWICVRRSDKNSIVLYYLL